MKKKVVVLVSVVRRAGSVTSGERFFHRGNCFLLINEGNAAPGDGLGAHARFVEREFVGEAEGGQGWQGKPCKFEQTVFSRSGLHNGGDTALYSLKAPAGGNGLFHADAVDAVCGFEGDGKGDQDWRVDAVVGRVDGAVEREHSARAAGEGQQRGEQG